MQRAPVFHRGRRNPDFFNQSRAYLDSQPGVLMLNRLTISALLKSVIAVMAACVVAFLIMTAWDSWGRLQTAARISVIADASAHAFKAMSNLRTDRATTSSEFERRRCRHGRLDQDAARLSRRHQSGAALRCWISPRRWNFRSEATLLPSLTQQFDSLKALQTEIHRGDRAAEGVAPGSAWQGICRCRDHVAADDWKSWSRSSPPPSATVDPVVDQLLAIKQLAWQVRDTGGQAAVLLSHGIERRPPAAGSTPDLRQIRDRRGIFLEGAGDRGGGNAAAGQPGRSHGRDQDGLFRAAISGVLRAIAECDDRRRENRSDVGAMESRRDRAPRRRGQAGRARARRGQAPRRGGSGLRRGNR